MTCTHATEPIKTKEGSYNSLYSSDSAKVPCSTGAILQGDRKEKDKKVTVKQKIRLINMF